MVYGIAYYPSKKEEELKGFGFMDSKVLKAEERERLFQVMQRNHIGYMTDVISARELSEKMLLRYIIREHDDDDDDDDDDDMR